MSLPIVIVGGGTAGSTVALQLATRTDRPIVVCEPGGISPWDDDARFFNALSDARLFTYKQVIVAGRSFDYLQANAVGGGSAINGMLLTGDDSAYVEGLTSIPNEDDIGDVSRALLASGGRLCRLWWNRGRWNPGRALLHLVEEGRVEWRRSAASRIVTDGPSVAGVVVDGSVIDTDCVVLAAGAIASPALLLSSGIDSLNHSIGRGLQDHPSISFVCKRSTDNHGRFDAAVVRDVELSDGVIGLMVAYERCDAISDSTALVTVMLMNPESRGVISQSVNGIAIDLGLLSTQRDTEAMRLLVRDAITVVARDDFAYVVHDIVAGSQGTALVELAAMSDAQLDAWIDAEVQPVSHVSCSLSESVDHQGRLKGVQGVVVADASVLSHVPHETPAAAVTMEAQRIGQLLGEDLA